ncbi:MAG: Unknown protein [uncultured Sulfurovum sp.]|uniref:Uncharacterized protein n=1 Tax=uncultured Sulfurovum sp. TaxID=269237 RepID=A0A6S6SNY1_9BACT|nr:MAG: Unknown protein [uncultured Sulfurovum sp.]
MNKSNKNQTLLFKIFTLLSFMSMPIMAEVVTQKQKVETIEVSLDSFGLLSMVLLVIISSLVGMFFMKDEFSELT